MKFLKALGVYLAADILCMFINITFAALHYPMFRVLCAVCTAGIMCVMTGNFALVSAAADAKTRRASGSGKSSGAAGAFCGILAVPALSWGTLLASMGGGSDFYRWYKIMNGAFLRVINFIEPDASSSALSTAEVMTMLPFAVIPAAVYLTVYIVKYSEK